MRDAELSKPPMNHLERKKFCVTWLTRVLICTNFFPYVGNLKQLSLKPSHLKQAFKLNVLIVTSRYFHILQFERRRYGHATLIFLKILKGRSQG